MSRASKYVVLLLCLLLLAGCGHKAKPVLTCETADFTMDEDQFQFYFGYQYATVLETLGAKAFNPNKPLSEQSYDDTQSWQEFLLTQALNHAEQTAQLCAAAKEAGFSIPAAQSPGELENITAQTAKENHYTTKSGEGDPLAYLTACFGKGASLAGYGEFLQAMSLAEAYAEHLRTAASYTAQEIEAFYDSHATDYEGSFGIPKNGNCRLDVRMIRFYPNDPGNERDWSEAEARANQVMEQLRADPTDEKFAALADASTEDYNAPMGGLYEELAPGRSVDALDNWLFPKDTLRSPGDFSLIREDDVYTLCYISAVEERPYWQVIAEQDMRYADYITALGQLQEQYSFTRYPENVTLRVPTAHTATDDIPGSVEAVG